jgi:outer membrane usher protein
VRVVRDIQKLTARASAGDLIYPVSSFQIFRPMQGGAIRSQFSMTPSKLTYPSGQYEIYLKNKSKVYIWVNDQLQQVLDLPAGRHELKDLSFAGGMNNVRFEIVDEFGQTEVQDHSYFSTTELLKKGLHDYSYAFGNPSSSSTTTGDRIYDSSNATFSGYHRVGLSSHFTAGVNLQHDSLQTIGGLEGMWSLKVGYLKIEPEYSDTKGMGAGYAFGTHYTYSDYIGPDKTQRMYNLGIIYRSDLFTQLGETTQGPVVKPIEFVASTTRGISKTASVNFGVNYDVNKKITTDFENSFSIRAGASNRWQNGVTANVTANHTHSQEGNDQISIMAFLIWTMPQQRQSVSASVNTADNSSRLGWSYAPSSGADSATYQADYHNGETEKGYSANYNLNGNHSRLSAAQQVILPKKDEPSTPVDETEKAINVTTLQIGTALVFAGGRFGIGRPVTDSFAIIDPVKSLKGQHLMVNDDAQGNYVAKSDWLGPAVVPEIGSYNPSVLAVSGKDLPLGMSIPQDHFNLFPSYKNGYGFKLGTDAVIYLKVTVVGPDGKPVEMAAGQADYLSDSSMAPVTVFTNRKGRIQSEGFKSGKYRLSIESDKYEPIEFTIPESAKEEFDLGTLKLKEKGK